MRRSIRAIAGVAALPFAAVLAASSAHAEPPITWDASANVPCDTTWNITLGYRDNTGGGPFAATFAAVAPPSHGSVTFVHNIATYTPALGYSGADGFTFTATTVNGTSNVATASITVAACALPVAHAASFDVPYQTPTPLTLTATDANPGGPFDFTFAITSPPQHGNVDIAGDVATYTPAAGYSGADAFMFAATTINGASAPATVSVSVGPSPAHLVLSIDDGRDTARYGTIVDYVVTLANTGGSTAGDVATAFSLSAGFDGDFARIACFGDGGGASCAPDVADPLRFSVALPPDRSLIWLIEIPVREDADGATVDLGVTADGAVSVIDSDVLVIHRDGFDASDGDDARFQRILQQAVQTLRRRFGGGAHASPDRVEGDFGETAEIFAKAEMTRNPQGPKR